MIFKSFDANSDSYLTPDGKYIIFRQVRGRVVPIKTDAQDFAQHMEQNGIQIDPADQNQLHIVESYLDNLKKVGESAGPAAQMKYEKELEAAIQQKQAEAYGIKSKYTAQLNQNRHQTPEKIQADQQTQAQRLSDYEASAGEVKNRKNLPNKGWDDYLTSYTESIVGHNPVGSVGHASALAFGGMLKEGLKHAMAGTTPATLDLNAVLDATQKSIGSLAEELRGVTGKSKLENQIELIKGVDSLKLALQDPNSEFTKDVTQEFISIFSQMSHDFNSRKAQAEQKIQMTLPKRGRLETPDELPPEIVPQEIDSLRSLFNREEELGRDTQKITHKIVDHLLTRLINTYPGGKSKMQADMLSADMVHSVTSLHRDGFMHATSKKDHHTHRSRSSQMQVILNEVENATESKSATAYLVAIKRVAETLGEIDGYAELAKNPNAKPREITDAWNKISGGASRQFGSPSLSHLIMSEDVRSRAGFSNAQLHIPWRKPEESSEQTGHEVEFDLQFPEDPVPPPLKKSNFIVNDKHKIVSADGRFSVEPTKTLGILSVVDVTQGKSVAQVDTNKLQTKTKDALLEHLANVVESIPDTSTPDVLDKDQMTFGRFQVSKDGSGKADNGWTIKPVTEDGVHYVALHDDKGTEVSSVRVSSTKDPKNIDPEFVHTALSQFNNSIINSEKPKSDRWEFGTPEQESVFRPILHSVLTQLEDRGHKFTNGKVIQGKNGPILPVTSDNGHKFSLILANNQLGVAHAKSGKLEVENFSLSKILEILGDTQKSVLRGVVLTPKKR